MHLAGHPDEASLPDSLTSHVVTTAALLDAMVEHDVPRLVYAGSNHAVGRTPRTELLTTDVRPRPDTFYGVGKVAAEALMSLYADRYALDTVSCRIGSFLPEPETTRHLSTWLSHDDGVRMVHAALTATAPGFAVLYGISANTRAWWDLAPGAPWATSRRTTPRSFAARVPAAPADDAVGGRPRRRPVSSPRRSPPGARPRLSVVAPGVDAAAEGMALTGAHDSRTAHPRQHVPAHRLRPRPRLHGHVGVLRDR